MIQLYRYFGSHAFETLRDRKLMMAVPSTLNDPFEFLFKSAGTMTAAKARRYIRGRIKSPTFYETFKELQPGHGKKDFKKFVRENKAKMISSLHASYENMVPTDPEYCHDLADKHHRISCFTAVDLRAPEELLMWAHYAAKHSGVRIRFSLNEDTRFPYFLKKVKYSKERVGMDLTGGAESEAVRTALKEAIATKGEGWAYEKEFRMFCRPSECSQEQSADGTRRYFFPIDSEMILEVDLGLRCGKTESDLILNLVRAEYPNVKVRQAMVHKSDYALEYKDLN